MQSNSFRKVPNILARLSVAVEISLGKVAREAMFPFTRDLIDVEDSFSRNIHQIVNAGELLGQFSEKTVPSAAIEQIRREMEEPSANPRISMRQYQCRHGAFAYGGCLPPFKPLSLKKVNLPEFSRKPGAQIRLPVPLP
jgi:hypothetical protein